MLFPSLEFLYFFFPITIGIYYLIPISVRNYWLLLCSLFFYAWGEPKFVFVMIGSIIFNFLIAIRMEEAAVRWQRKVFLIIAVVGNLSLIGVFKYANFIMWNLRRIPSLTDSIPRTQFILPIGISFFTFQALSYVIDVFRGVPAQKNPFYLGLYISFFPQLIAGPIVRYTTVVDQIRSKRLFCLNDFCEGIIRFLYGFNKKMLLANPMSEIADAAFGSQNLTTAFAWMGAVAYTLQIYFDFSGYSDMAIGLGRMFGFSFLENFRYPYIAGTVSEFWRRWHISLSSWFRDYVYIPMGGGRVSKMRVVRNLIIVWLLTGIWHGANWTFIGWGIGYGIIITIEKVTDLERRIRNHFYPACIYRFFTIIVFICGWVVFRSDHLSNASHYLLTMFFIRGELIDPTTVFYFREYFIMIIVGSVFATPMLIKIKRRMFGDELICSKIIVLILFVLFLISISFIVMNFHNPFIYFNF